MNSVIITAGGTSSRFKGENKLLYELNSKPVISYSAELFNSLDYIDEIIISSNKSIFSDLEKMFAGLNKVRIIEGGLTRQQSVYNGLCACNNPDFVVIHDGARPFVTEKIIKDCLNKAYETNAAIAAVKTIDTIKIADDKNFILSTPNRNSLWNAQTPQVFKFDLIYSLHKKYCSSNFTDDSLLFEAEGLPVYIVESEYSNYKITTFDDIKAFEKT